MELSNIVGYAVAAGVVLIVLFIVGFSLSRMYRKSTKDTALVKTGLGGEKVITTGGFLLIPGFQELMKVNMRTLRIRVERKENEGLITLDCMRVDIASDFFVRVASDDESIKKAAQALGDRLSDPDKVKELMESKFVGALRSAAASMSMDELHKNRPEFVLAVQKAIAEELAQNGLELESVSLTSFDQTKLDFFDPDNAFDAQGRAKLAETIEGRKKRTNEVEQENRIAIEQRNLEAEKESLAIKQQKREAEILQEQEIQVKEAEQKALIAGKREEQEQKERQAEISKNRAIESSEIEKKLALDKMKIEQNRDLEVAEQDRQIIIAQKSEAESAARAKAAEAEKDRVEKEEAVITAGKVAGAERQKQIDVIDARRKAEREAVAITVAAEASKQAAQDDAESKLIVAKADADAILMRADADEKKYDVDAAGRRKLNEADNALSAEQVELRRALATLEALPQVIAQAVEPLKNIDGIKILQGYNGTSNVGSGNDGSGASGNPMSQLTNAALAYKAQSPVVTALLSELGLGGSLEELVDGKSIASLMSNATNSVKSIADSTPKADNGSADVSDNPDFTSVENFTTAEADVSERNADS
jgi:flotillin